MKKKLFMITLAVCLIVLSIAGTSLAYFTDTDAKSTVFTAGNVDIDLAFNQITTKLYPGVTYNNSAIISNTGSEDAYVGAIIRLRGAEIKNVVNVTSGEKNIPVAITKLFSGLGATGYKVQYEVLDNGYDIYVVLIEKLAGKVEGTVQTATIFNSIAIPEDWDNAQMGAVKGASVEIIAYATQTVGEKFTSAESALKTASPTEWGGWEVSTNSST